MANQWAVPSADLADGTWTNQAGNGTNLFASVDEAEAAISDVDHLVSSENPVDDTCRLSLSAIGAPAAGTVRIKIRAKRDRLENYWFTWSPVVGATSYVLQVGPSTGTYTTFTKDVGNVTAYGLYLASGTYYSRMVPQGAGSATAERMHVVP